MSTPVLDRPVGNRPWQAARIQLISPPLHFLMPWAVLALTFVVNLLIFSLVPDNGEPYSRITGGLLSLYIFTLVTHLVTITQLFPFALGLSVTRRDFYLGSSGFIVVQAAVQGSVLTALAAIERATGGWGIRMSFFDLPFMRTGDWFTHWLVFVGPFLFLSFTSILAGAIFKRFGQLGLWTVGLVLLVLAGTAVVLLTWLGGWGAVGRFFVETPPLLLFAGYPAALAALAAAAGWATLRRAMV